MRLFSACPCKLPEAHEVFQYKSLKKRSYVVNHSCFWIHETSKGEEEAPLSGLTAPSSDGGDTGRTPSLGVKINAEYCSYKVNAG